MQLEKFLLSSLVGLSFCGNMSAGEGELSRVSYEDSLQAIVNRYKADTLVQRDLELNPRYYRLFGLPTLYASSVERVLAGATSSASSAEIYQTGEEEYLSAASDAAWQQQDILEEEIDRAVLVASVVHPEHFEYTEEEIKSEQVITASDVAEQVPTANFLPVASSLQDADKAVGVDMKVKKPNFWITSGSGSLQFTQNYISGNWSQGGESTNTMLAELVLKANYNDQQRIQWDNTFEAKLGLTTTPSDKEHDYRTNTDLVRITSKLLLKAIKSWNYSFEVVSKTQSLRSYQSNSTNYTAAFLAPLDTKVSIGMDYKKSWKNFNISVNLAPLSYRWLYVYERALGSRYGIKDNHRSLQEYGSSTTINSSWQIAKNIRWTSRIDAFTSYEKMLANWENTFEFSINKYLSTKLFMHGRFDDGVPLKDGYTYFQFKEYLQFGLSYKW